MTKKIRKPLIDVNWYSLAWEYIWEQDLEENTVMMFKKTKEDFEKKERNLIGEIYVKWFWRVK